MTTPVGNSDDGAMFSSKPEEIETFTGRFVNLLTPDPDTIVIEDIAHHLSLLCRYGGATKRFYSIAEHCCLVMDLMQWVPLAPRNIFEFVNGDESLATMQYAALFHDSPEAYLNDMTAPAKYAMREVTGIAIAKAIGVEASVYDVLENIMAGVINLKFDITQSLRPEIKIADLWAMKIEAKELTHSGGKNWRWTGQLPFNGQLPDNVKFYGGLKEELAEELFLTQYNEVQNSIQELKAIREEA